MQLVLDVSRMLAATSDLDPLLHYITQAVAALLNCDRASIFLHDEKTRELWTKVALGLDGREIRIPAGAGIVGATFSSNRMIHVSDPYHDPRFNPESDRKTGFVTRNILSAPMVDLEHTPVGVVQAINKLGDDPQPDFSVADRSMLQLLCDQAGVAIQRSKLQQAAIESASLRKELDLAKKVQEAMIPRTMPDVPGLQAAGWTKAASVNGGDCFDLWKLCDGRLGILVADASGHGIAPALVVMQARTLVRSLSDTEMDPLKLLLRVNTRLAQDMVPGRFVTMFVGFLSPDGELEWASGGHGPILVRPRHGAPLETFDPTLPPIGLLDHFEEERAPVLKLEVGGTLVVPSDGITESFSPEEELFGDARLCATLDACDAAGDDCAEAKQIVETIQRATNDWQRGEEPKDDQTVVVVRRT
jgi:phosphoserine phosphatase